MYNLQQICGVSGCVSDLYKVSQKSSVFVSNLNFERHVAVKPVYLCSLESLFIQLFNGGSYVKFERLTTELVCLFK